MILYHKCVGTGDKEELEDGASQVRGEESQVFLIWHKAWQISLATKEHSRVIYILRKTVGEDTTWLLQ